MNLAVGNRCKLGSSNQFQLLSNKNEGAETGSSQLEPVSTPPCLIYRSSAVGSGAGDAAASKAAVARLVMSHRMMVMNRWTLASRLGGLLGPDKYGVLL